MYRIDGASQFLGEGAASFEIATASACLNFKNIRSTAYLNAFCELSVASVWAKLEFVRMTTNVISLIHFIYDCFEDCSR